MNKHRMNKELSSFAARLRGLIATRQPAIGDSQFSALALELFALQFRHNPAYQTICQARGVTPAVVEHWTQVPAVPAGAFKELELSCIPPEERIAVFHSSGTTEQKPSRHFHSGESLAVYETSLRTWFAANLRFTIYDLRLLCLTPPPMQAPYSSLVHMFEAVRRKFNAPESVFVGQIDTDGAWTLNFDAALAALTDSTLNPQPSTVILGTAFSFVHLLDYLAENNLKFQLPENSRLMETGGYKNRSRSVPRAELHALIAERLGIAPENIICEYGMSELSSQAYDREFRSQKSEVGKFRFPPWARGQIISPETGREVADGETGLIRVFDLANAFSVAAIQTEDLGIRRGDGFELIGRAPLAEPRGCSLMTA
jgi:hypothetical protein